MSTRAVDSGPKQFWMIGAGAENIYMPELEVENFR